MIWYLPIYELELSYGLSLSRIDFDLSLSRGAGSYLLSGLYGKTSSLSSSSDMIGNHEIRQ